MNQEHLRTLERNSTLVKAIEAKLGRPLSPGSLLGASLLATEPTPDMIPAAGEPSIAPV